MSISPATDIVLDVARAADPARYKRAVAKLDATAGAEFTDSLAAEAAEPAKAATAPAATVARQGTRTTVPMADAAPAVKTTDTATDRATATYRQFESMALANMLEAAMPGDDDGFFGKGVAGSTWKSMMIDQIAGEMAKHGGIGIAEQLSRSARAAHDAPAAHVAAATTTPTDPTA